MTSNLRSSHTHHLTIRESYFVVPPSDLAVPSCYPVERLLAACY